MALLLRRMGKTSNYFPKLYEVLPSSFLKVRKNSSDQIEFETKPYKLHKLDAPPPSKVSVNKEDALEILRKMLVIRKMETAAAALYREKLIYGFCHLYSGQEAVGVGIHSALRPQDQVITSYRCHGWVHLMGVPVHQVLAELMGKESGCSQGKGGSMHMYGTNFYGGNGIVGALVPLGAGIAFANKYRKNNAVCLTLYGDGAANQGQLFETFNITKLWNLPIVFVCENNRYGMGTAANRAAASTQYYTRGDYIPGLWVDGMDILSVQAATKYAIEYALAGNGPLIIEADTYRYYGHSMSDPGTSYRTREEIQSVRESKDPITSFQKLITSANLATEEEIKSVDKAVKQVVDNAVEKARKDKTLDISHLSWDTHTKPLTQIRGNTPWEKLEDKLSGTPINV